MLLDKFDFAEKAASLKAQSLALDTEYVESRRAHWLIENALHNAYSALAGAANKLENAPQNGLCRQVASSCATSTPISPQASVENPIALVISEIMEIDQLLGEINIELAKTDPVYAGKMLKQARTARTAAEALDKLSAAIATSLTGVNEVLRLRGQRSETSRTPKQRYAVVKGSFTHTRGGTPVRFYTGEHCPIDNELDNGDKRIAGDNGGTSVFFKADEVACLFDIVEA